MHGYKFNYICQYWVFKSIGEGWCEAAISMKDVEESENFAYTTIDSLFIQDGGKGRVDS
jgi:hypothetical protein